MQLTLSGLSALSVLRELRQSRALRIARLPHTTLAAPDAGSQRWTQRRIHEHLSGFPSVAAFEKDRPLHVAVPSAKDRLRVNGVTNEVWSSGIPENSFIDVGPGLQISCPELVFVELASVMDLPSHLLLGMELCGNYARSASDPRNGDAAYRLEPVTTPERIARYMASCRRVRGTVAARETLEYLVADAWSPMEAAVATLLILPAEELGYDMWPISLNQRKGMGEGASKETRLPDVLFHATRVGLNYDGEDHLPVGEVVNAAYRLASDPGSMSSENELEEAIARLREGSVGDKRRDRDLGASGYVVLPITKEDLYEYGGLDRVMRQVVACIEREGKRRLDLQRRLLESPVLARHRQDLIWSLLPGRVGAEAALRRAQRAQAQGKNIVVNEETIVDGVVVESRTYPL